MFGDLRLVEFDTGSPMDAAVRALARFATIVIDGAGVGSIVVGIDIGNNRKESAGSDPDLFYWDLECGIDSVS